MHEWPLVIFTLLMQTSVGCLLCALICYRRILTSLPSEQALAIIRIPLISAFILGGLGLLASVFHLGNPLHMFYTLLNVSSSWMSREVLVTGIYMGLLFTCITVMLVKRHISSGLLLCAVLVGLSDVYVMSAIYDNTLFNLWRGWFTYAAFYGSTLLAGGMLAGYLSAMKASALKRQAEFEKILRLSLAVCAVGIALLLISSTSLLTQVEQPVSLGISPAGLSQNLFDLSLIRIALVSIGLFMACRSLWNSNKNRLAGLTLSLSLGCIIAGEIMGRYIFFSFVA